MVAVLALSQSGGGVLQRAIASPSTRVESTRDSRISRRFCSLYRQFTDRPARLINARAPSSSLAQSVSEQAANEATAPSNDDAIPHVPILLESVSLESLTELSRRL